MSSYTNCLLQGYGVLPGPPSKLHLTNIDTDYAVVHWSAPAALADTVQYYNLHFRTLAADDDYRAIERVSYLYMYLSCFSRGHHHHHHQLITVHCWT
jgi:hypothetical protein